jgi:F1F0 ATPase subunit 2
MPEVMAMTIAWAAGLALGGFFFLGLWWTVRWGLVSPRPALLFLASVLLRMGVTLAGFYFVADGQWERLLLALAGFIMARPIVTWMTRPAQPGGAKHAS